MIPTVQSSKRHHDHPTRRRSHHPRQSITTPSPTSILLFLLLLLLSNNLPPSQSFTTPLPPSLLPPPLPTALSMTQDPSIDTTEDPRLYRIRIPRAPGIEWGTDLSFSFVYVRSMEPSGPAAMSGLVSVGDQICELRSVVYGEEGAVEEGEPVPLIGAPFDAVMGAFAGLERSVVEVDIVFFRGSKEELIALCNRSGGEEGGGEDDGMITITVVHGKGTKAESVQYLRAPMGSNVRNVLTEAGINVYQSVTRWTNCDGKQLCGTCIVNVVEGRGNTNRKGIDEESTLRENPEGYRLSCVTFAYGDVTVETFPPVEAAQWTR